MQTADAFSHVRHRPGGLYQQLTPIKTRNLSRAHTHLPVLVLRLVPSSLLHVGVEVGRQLLESLLPLLVHLLVDLLLLLPPLGPERLHEEVLILTLQLLQLLLRVEDLRLLPRLRDNNKNVRS